MSEFSQGLTISGFGILITFSALAILIGLIFLLKVIFPAKGEKTPPQESGVTVFQVAHWSGEKS